MTMTHPGLVINWGYFCDWQLEENIDRTIGWNGLEWIFIYSSTNITFWRDFSPVVGGETECARDDFTRAVAAGELTAHTQEQTEVDQNPYKKKTTYKIIFGKFSFPNKVGNQCVDLGVQPLYLLTKTVVWTNS